MEIIAMIAGIGYLLQKIFLLVAEGDESSKGRSFRIAGWISYLVGLPMWIVIFYKESNWILAFIEGGGAPSMTLGLIIAIRRQGKSLIWLDRLAIVTTFIGIAVSFYYFGGLVAITQWLEIGVSVGFLGGTYLLAKKNPKGWLWYMFMNGSAGTLMWVQGYPVLTLQQSFSLTIVIIAYIKARDK